MSTKTANQEDAPKVEPDARETPTRPEPSVTLETFARRNAWQINSEGERVKAVALMAGFVHKMRQEGRNAAPASEYQTYWDKFGDAKKN